MGMFIWDSNYETGLVRLDEQHSRLVATMNQLDDAITFGATEERLQNLLSRLVDYTEYHFSYEELLMYNANLDEHDITRHIEQHASFVHKLQALEQAASQDPNLICRDLMDFLVNWLSRHILGTDKRMAAVIAAQDTSITRTDASDPATTVNVADED